MDSLISVTALLFTPLILILLLRRLLLIMDDGTIFPSSSIQQLTTVEPSSSAQWKYDVFLSFSADTRKSFTDHLYARLKRDGFITFRDDKSLDRGEMFPPELLKAIGDSFCSVIVFSIGYAFSNWCLDELVEINRQRKEKGRKIFPVFYHIPPAELRSPRQSVKEAFVRHESRYSEEKMRSWRDTLIEVANIGGWPVENRYESEIIEDIVKKISIELNEASSSVFNDLIGIRPRLDELCNKIIFGEDDVRIIGICGMGGIGKTTLARVVYGQMSVGFEGKCFLKCDRKVSKDIELVPLQQQLLREIFPKEDFPFFNVYDGKDMIRRRLRNKKVLLVIDDVDKKEYLECLAEKRDWFGCGSRIIITTRDEQLLRAYKLVDDVYRPTKLNASESRRLLCLKAFDNDTLEDDFMSLSQSVLEYADGLPLALEVLGRDLYDKGAAYWERAIERIKGDLKNEIHNCLYMSYEGLEEEENKKIFLDIAHFFNGADKDFVTEILDGCEYYPDIGLDDLIKKSLITIEDNKIWIHKLLQEMGRKIVRQKSPDEPGKRCRLTEEKDVYHVLTKNLATEAIEGMVINIIPREPNRTFTLNVNEAFSKMKKLRLLIVHNFPESFNVTYFSSELRLFKWHKYPLKALPLSIQPENFVALVLPNSCIEQLCDGDNSLNKLKIIDLHDSPKLIKTPDFTKAECLEMLNLEGCTNLEHVDPSIASLLKLKVLDLSGCSKLESLPDFGMTKNLENLNLEGCTSLVDVHPSIAFLRKLKLLNLKNCTSLTSLPTNIGMKSLEKLILSGCRNLQRFPEIAGRMECLSKLCLDGTAIEELPSSVGHLSSLVFLDLKDCRNLVSLPSNINGLECLKLLDISGCSKLESLSDFGMTKNLENLNLEGCTSLVDVHPSIASLCKLKLLNLKNCTSLTSLPTNIGMESLETLVLSGCRNLQRFPEIAGRMECLLKLCLDGTAIEELPSSVGHLSSLVFLDLKDCGNLVSLLSNINGLKCLKVLDLSGCSKLESLPDFGMTKNLEELNLEGCNNLVHVDPSIAFLPKLKLLNLRNCTGLKSLPTNIGMESLETLILSGCRNLERFPEIAGKMECLSKLCLDGTGIEELPSSVGHLSSLVFLDLKDCGNLVSLPSKINGLECLKLLDISGCSEL